MYRSENDRSTKAQEYNTHKYYSEKIYLTDNKLQYGMHTHMSLARIMQYRYTEIWNNLCYT